MTAITVTYASRRKAQAAYQRAQLSPYAVSLHGSEVSIGHADIQLGTLVTWAVSNLGAGLSLQCH